MVNIGNVQGVITEDASRVPAKVVEWTNPEVSSKMLPSLWFTKRYYLCPYDQFENFQASGE